VQLLVLAQGGTGRRGRVESMSGRQEFTTEYSQDTGSFTVSHFDEMLSRGKIRCQN